MQHIESNRTKVYKSKEYSRFQFINGNRAINDGKLKKIIAEIDNGNDMLRYYPIQVREQNEKLMILDGQHRFYLSKFFQRPVYYIIVEEEKKMMEIARVNSNVEKWKNVDYINCYVQHDIKDYIIVRDFLEKYKVALTIGLQMLNLGHPGTDTGSNASLNENFRNGSFKVKYLEKATEIAENALKFSLFPHCMSRSFVIAIYRITEAKLVKLEEVLQAFLKHPDMLTQQANYKAYINILEQILNMGKRNRIVII